MPLFDKNQATFFPSERQQKSGLVALLDSWAPALAVFVAIAKACNGFRVLQRDPGKRAYIRNATLVGQRLIYGILLLIGLLLAIRFAVFWFSPARLPRDFGDNLELGNVALFAGLTFVIWHRQAIDIIGWLICSRVEPHYEPPLPAEGLRVAFLTTFVPGTESPEILRQTLASMVLADYPHDTWLLDEGDNYEVRAMCELLGVKHFSRNGIDDYNQARGRFLAKSKAGNHNAWYARHARKYEIVAQVDSDFTVRRDFLTRTLGYFRIPEVAFVGTPQIYGNLNNWVARGAAQQTYLFYGPIMRALSRRRMTLLIGANHVVRVGALEDIGWYEGHLTEDLATGKRFHADRWESIYVPEPLTIGEGPTSLTAYFNQQYRWAFGCINIFFTHSPRLNFKMRWSHALYYFLLEQFYFTGLTMAIAVALLMMYYFFGWAPAQIQIHQLAVWYMPLLAWRQVILLWLQRFNVRPREERGLLWAGRLLTVIVIPIYFLALIGVVRNKKMTFKTTPKGENSSGSDSLRIFVPHLVLSGLMLVGMSVGLALGHRGWVFLAWGCVTTGLLSALFIGKLCKRLFKSLRWRRIESRDVESAS